MSRIFIVYCAAITLAFTVATYKGYAFNSLFANKRHTSATENHYYHK